MKRLVFAALVSFGLAWAGAAGATDQFPGAMKTHLALAAAPSCAVCHTNGQTGAGTVNAPFGLAMKAAGLVKYDVASLNAALDKLAQNKTDSDGDGVSDVDELKAGTDPNVGNGDGGVAIAVPEPPQYGVSCAATASGNPDSPLAAIGIAFAVAAALAKRRRARS